MEVERQIALDDLVHGVFTRKASEINNQGEGEQIAFLKSEGWTDKEIEEGIQEGCSGRKGSLRDLIK